MATLPTVVFELHPCRFLDRCFPSGMVCLWCSRRYLANRRNGPSASRSTPALPRSGRRTEILKEIAGWTSGKISRWIERRFWSWKPALGRANRRIAGRRARAERPKAMAFTPLLHSICPFCKIRISPDAAVSSCCGHRAAEEAGRREGCHRLHRLQIEAFKQVGGIHEQK